MNALLTRSSFREAVFSRDQNKCAMCDSPAKDAHHIIERRLFHDGGYYLNNGASLCEEHHLQAEMTTLSVEEIRQACGIPEGSKVIPEHLYRDETYDKWGNLVFGTGLRAKGELFNDPSVQKILKVGGVLDLFQDYVKYPRTYHLQFSPGATRDDRVLHSHECFEGKEVVMTLKMDGENTTMYRDRIHARSLDSKHHESRWWVKRLQAQIGQEIPEGWRVCGENMYAEHTIRYERLPSYFLGFSIWNNDNVCLGWDETLEWFSLLGIAQVPVIYEGIWDEKIVLNSFPEEYNGNPCEGFVIRLREAFHYAQFRTSVAKYVSAQFRKSMEGDEENFKPWYLRKVVPNRLESHETETA
jgi:hypothetical protein